MESLIHILYSLTTALLMPVVLILLLLLAWVLLQTGGFLREWIERKRKNRNWSVFAEKHGETDADPDAARRIFFGRTDYPGLVAAFAKRGEPYKNSPDDLDRIIAEIEIEANEECSWMNLWVRIGPMLGLMGTLIPMGPALVGLSSRNRDVLAPNLVVAFSTTVVGLIIGALCSIISVTKRHWYVRDISRIERIMETLFLKEAENAGLEKDVMIEEPISECVGSRR